MRADAYRQFDANSRSRLQLARSSCQSSFLHRHFSVLQPLLVRSLARPIRSLQSVEPGASPTIVRRVVTSRELQIARFVRGSLRSHSVTRCSPLASLRRFATCGAGSLVCARHPMTSRATILNQRRTAPVS